MESVVLTGAAGPIAEQLVARLSVQRPDTKFTVLAPRPFGLAPGTTGVEVQVVDLVHANLAEIFAGSGADAVVHLGIPVDGLDPYQLAPGRAAAEARAVLDAVERAGVTRLVVVSSALVYGALASNAVPLTEDAVVHPDHGMRPAVELAEIEREVGDWREEVASISTTILRTAPVVAEEAPGWLASELHRSLAYPVADHDPHFQYLHVHDLADAVLTVLGRPFDGVCNVAPDGWLTGPERRALETRPRVRVPRSAARAAASLRGAARGTDGPEGIQSYVTHPWVLANDRLRTLGWEPSVTSDEAYVAAFRAAPWSMVSSSRRQELALGAAGVAVVGIGAAIATVVVRRRHR